ncbi:putative ribonuclease H-like domain-containing protein [Tanacetum coccineum]
MLLSPQHAEFGKPKTVVHQILPEISYIDDEADPDETSGILKNFITEIENQLDHKVKTFIRCDNGTEFKNNVMNQFWEIKGIKREFSVARTPHQNGVAEKRNSTLIKAARTMYSIVSKAMRLFNKRNNIVEETLNLRFLENTPNVTGNGLAWLFDVDFFVNRIYNYVPVVAAYGGSSDEEEKAIDAIPLATNLPLIVDY